jgi:imidazole glycerol phosphate synthase subunit HisF
MGVWHPAVIGGDSPPQSGEAMIAFVTLASAVTVNVAAATPATSEPLAKIEPACAMVQSIDSWTDVDTSTVILETSPRRRYKVTFTGPCPDVKRATLALIQREASAGACLSPGDSIIFARKASTGAQNYDYDARCTIKTITPLPVIANSRSSTD